MQTFTDIFRKPSARSLAQSELEEARRELLAAQTLCEYAKSRVDYNTVRVARLESYLQEPV